MAQITSADELLRAFPDGFRAEEMEAKLAQKGMPLAPELAPGFRAARTR